MPTFLPSGRRPLFPARENRLLHLNVESPSEGPSERAATGTPEAAEERERQRERQHQRRLAGMARYFRRMTDDELDEEIEDLQDTISRERVRLRDNNRPPGEDERTFRLRMEREIWLLEERKRVAMNVRAERSRRRE